MIIDVNFKPVMFTERTLKGTYRPFDFKYSLDKEIRRRNELIWQAFQRLIISDAPKQAIKVKKLTYRIVIDLFLTFLLISTLTIAAGLVIAAATRPMPQKQVGYDISTRKT
jgi:hypothetical protein